MRLKKKRPNNHWLKSQGHYLSCFSTSKPSEPIRFACDMRLKTRYSLKATTKIPPPPHSRKKEVPILRSQGQTSKMTDWHILPGLKIDVLIACCRLPVSPQNTECCPRYSASGHLQKFAADSSLSTSQNSPLYKIVTLSLNCNQNFYIPAP